MSIKAETLVNACKRRPLLCTCAVLGLALLLCLYLRMDMVGVTESALEERSKQLKKLKTNAIYSVQLEQQIKALKEVNQTLTNGAVREGELAKNQQLFLRLEAETGVKLMELRAQPVPPPAKGAPATSYVPINFSVTISGEYKQLIAFLIRLDQGPTLSRIANAAITSSDFGQQMTLTVELLGLRR